MVPAVMWNVTGLFALEGVRGDAEAVVAAEVGAELSQSVTWMFAETHELKIATASSRWR